MKIKDSGNRTQFQSGAVRDVQGGKGRCDLMPLDVIAKLNLSAEIRCIARFQATGDIQWLLNSICEFKVNSPFNSMAELTLEVSKHFEEGALKYGENNWQKGIPLHSYIDSAIRHLLKHRSGWTDEPHDKAFCWNLMCAAWTMQNKPELDDFTINKEG